MNPEDKLITQQHLSLSEARGLFRRLFGSASKTPEESKKVLVLLRKKGEHATELAALVQTIRKLEKPPARFKLPYLVDGCGTGGDGKQAFNISTTACLVAAAAGAHVAKHGNRSITSRCGSSDLLESLGYNIHAAPKRLFSALKEAHFAYFHAPLYHPAFRSIQPIRLALAKKEIKTIFNLTGPLVNPIRLKKQVIGVFRKDVLNVMALALKSIGVERVWIVYNTDGFDELTTTSASLVIEVAKKKLKVTHIRPRALGFKKAKPAQLRGGNPTRNRAITIDILSGKDKGAKLDTVLLNAGAILYTSGRARDLKHGIQLAKLAINTRAALRTLTRTVRMSHDSR